MPVKWYNYASEAFSKEMSGMEFYTATTLAKEAGLSGSHVARLCREGEIEANKVGSVWIIQPEVAREWLQRRGAQ